MSASYEFTGPLHVVCKCHACEGVREMNNPVVKESLTTQPSLIDRLQIHLSCYWKEGDVAPQLTSIELMLIEEAANELAAAIASIEEERERAQREGERVIAAIEQRDKAVEALKHYGQHVDGCVDNESIDCICGYTTAMKECGK